MKLIHNLLCIALFTASCDVVLNVQVGGSLRLSQMLMMLVGLAAFARIIQHGRILWPKGATAFAIWVFWQGVCIPVAGAFGLAVQFYMLLLFTALGWFAMVQLYGESSFVEPLMKAYLWSYIAIAGYGALQFAGPLLFHVTMPFTRQWLVHGRVARISAFSYEPSYFATYMFFGYVMLTDLWRTRAEIVNSRAMRWGTVLVVAVLIFSSSKTAWLCMLFDLFTRIAPRAWRHIRYALGQLRHGRLPVPIPGRRTLSFVALGAAMAMVIAVGALILLPDPRILLGGTGIGGAPAHSVVYRNEAVAATWRAVQESPLIGRSMGGVPVAIAAEGGLDISTMAEARDHWGFPVLLDVFAGSGLFGFIPFAVFLWINTFGAYRLARQFMPLECAKWLHALARAMILEWVLLLGDQNLFRVYLWFHFGMVTLMMYYVEYGRFAVANREAAALPVDRSQAAPNLLGAEG